jgi:thymidylate kinase
VVLDAPGAVLFARKGEHSPGLLETWRQGYLDLERADLATDVHVVDATRPPEAVVAEVSRLVWRQLARRRGWADA